MTYSTLTQAVLVTFHAAQENCCIHPVQQSIAFAWRLLLRAYSSAPSQHPVMLQDDAEEAEWFDVREPPSRLAFDHKVIVRTAFEHLLKQHAGTGDS